VKAIAVGTEPETAVASPDGKWIVVSNETSNDVHVIDTATQAVVKKIAVPKNPRGLRFKRRRAPALRGQRAGPRRVGDRRATLTVEKSVATGGSRPVVLALSADGKRAWVSHGNSGDVRVLDAATLEPLGHDPRGPRAWWTALTPGRQPALRHRRAARARSW
jgi:YVTN family beta-propeller protein